MKINYSHDEITPEEIIKFLALTEQLKSVCYEIIKQKETLKKAKHQNILVSTDELQKFADGFRASHGLYSSQETHDFLDRRGLTEDDFEAYCEAILLTEKMIDHIADQKKIEEYFVNNHSDLDLARIYKIAVKEKNLADEILMQIQEEGKDFQVKAKQYSIDEATKHQAGYFGLITRSMLEAGVSAKVFNASAGDILGPFEKEGYFELIMVEEVIKAELNETIKERIKKLARKKVDIVITEIGGTVGDIEGLPFLEAIRQFRLDAGKDRTLYIHLTLIPDCKKLKSDMLKPIPCAVFAFDTSRRTGPASRTEPWNFCPS